VNSSPQTTSQRDGALDLIRFVSVLLVIAIHVAAFGFADIGSRGWWAINAFDSVARIAVPLFFMVTGALLVPRESSVPTILKRVFRIAIPLVVWSVVYLLWFRFTGDLSAPSALNIAVGPVVYHLWYLYALMGAYLLLPVISGLYRGNTTQTIIFILSVWFVGASVLPTITTLTGIAVFGVDGSLLAWVLGYLVLGAVLYKKFDFRRVRLSVVAGIWVLMTGATAMATWYLSVSSGVANETFYRYFSPFVVLAAVSAFVLLIKVYTQYFAQKIRVTRQLRWWSTVSFGIYLFHPLALAGLAKIGINYDFINPWLGIPLLTVGIFAISAGVVFLLQKIPFVRAIVPF
jgi:surface polysaccharide O-acyltransferase-like enzyme